LWHPSDGLPARLAVPVSGSGLGETALPAARPRRLPV